MKEFNPKWDGPLLKASEVVSESFYVCSNGVVTYSMKVHLAKVEDFGEGPFTVELPKTPAFDYILRNGGFYMNGGAQIPLALLAKAGQKTAYLSYTAPNLEDVPYLPTRPTVLTDLDSFFYNSGTYLTEELE